MDAREYRVGELAKRTGLTVRTLHHWDQVALLRPSRRTPSGHRLYGPDAVQRLQRIRSLRAMGLGLEEIGQALATDASTLEDVLKAQRDQVREQLRNLKALEGRLEKILGLLRDRGKVPEEELMKTMEMMTMIERPFAPEQLEVLQGTGKLNWTGDDSGSPDGMAATYQPHDGGDGEGNGPGLSGGSETRRSVAGSHPGLFRRRQGHRGISGRDVSGRTRDGGRAGVEQGAFRIPGKGAEGRSVRGLLNPFEG